MKPYIHDGGYGRPAEQCCVGLVQAGGHNPECAAAQEEARMRRFNEALDWIHEEAAKYRRLGRGG